jgi:hypothetical protein
MIYAYYSNKFLNTNIFKKKVVSLKLPSKQIQIVFYVRKYLSYPTGMTST